MDSLKKDNLQKAGINVEAALERFMGKDALLEKYLGRFLNEKSYADLLKAVEADDQEAAKMAAHSLKSVSGTIGCEAMQKLVVAQEAAMRSEKWAEAKSMMPEIEKAYNDACAAIKANL